MSNTRKIKLINYVHVGDRKNKTELKINTDGSLDVNVQDQSSASVDTYFLQAQSNFSLAVDTVASGIAEGHKVVS